MAKTELTRQIESALMAWVPTHYAGMRVDQNRNCICAKEVPVMFGSSRTSLIDYACVREYYVTDTKIATIIACVSIIGSAEDLQSLPENTLFGHCNYYAMPKALYAQVKDEIPEDSGVLLYYDGSEGVFCGIRKKKECVPHKLDTEMQKWLIMSIAKKATKDLQLAIVAKEKQDRHERWHSRRNEKY